MYNTHLGGVYTTTLLMNMLTLVLVFTDEVQCLHEAVLSAEVNYACVM